MGKSPLFIRKDEDRQQQLVMSGNCYIERFRHDACEMHDHNCIELVYVEQGTALHTIVHRNGNVEKNTLGPDDYVFLDYKTRHSYENGSKDFVIINFLFPPTLIQPNLYAVESFDTLLKCDTLGFDCSMLTSTPYGRVFHDDTGKLGDLFRKGLEAFKSRIYGNENLVRCYAIEILTLAMQRLLLYPSMDYVKSQDISEICDYVSLHYNEHISLTGICQERFFSLPYISKKFKASCGLTFEQYLQRVRINKACKLLVETNMPIAEIANAVGYDDVKSFRHIFVKLIQRNPVEYRQMFFCGIK